MKKRLLSQVPLEEAKEEFLKMAKGMKEDEYIVTAKEIKVDKKILLIYFYGQSDLAKENKQAAFRVFLSKDDYITQNIEESMKWRTGAIKNLLGGYYGYNWINKCTLGDEKSSRAIGEFLEVEENHLESIGKLQGKIMEDRLRKKHREITDKIDKKMEEIKELPGDFKHWIEYTALYDSRYIYYKYEPKKELDGYCTHCKKYIRIEGAKHNKKGICPNCKSDITFKATGMSRNVRDQRNTTIIQKAKDGIVVRHFHISKSYQKDYRKPELSYLELGRDFYKGKKLSKSYEYTEFKQSNKTRWCDSRENFRFNHTALYEKNLDEVLKDTPWKYSAMKELSTSQPGFKFSVDYYLRNYIEYPVLEYLVKLKLYRLTSNLIGGIRYQRGINLKGKKLEDVLNIDKKQLAIAQTINTDIGELEVIREFGKANINITNEQIVFIAKLLRPKNVIDMTKYTTVYKMIKYIKGQAKKEDEIRDTFNDWEDYIADCKALKRDLKSEMILFPNNLKESHDIAYKLVQANKDELFNKRIIEMNESLENTLGWNNKKYAIIAPKTSEEIMKEGQKLHHCVGNYVERIVKGKTIVLFLRKKEEIEEPFFTVEIDPEDKEVIQCRGKYNKSMEGEIKKIINKYEKEKLQPLLYKKVI